MKIYLSLFLTGFSLLFSFHSEAKFHFLHVPKTAGVTLHSLLQQNFKIEETFVFRQFSNTGQFDYLPKRVSRVFGYNFVSAHFPFWYFQKNDLRFGQNYIVTVLRDPIERVISHWTYINSRRNLKDMEPLQSPLDVHPNIMCKMFASDPNLTGEELLKSSIENLQKINFIIFQDDFENGVKALFAKLNFPIPQTIPVLNPSSKIEVSVETIKKIKELNALDIQLYEFANQHLREKFRAH